MVAKKNCDWKTWSDYRRLSQITFAYRYPILHIQDFCLQLNSRKFFSTLDLGRACKQIPMASEDIGKTALWSPRVPKDALWFCNSNQSFQHIFGQVFLGLDFVYAYIDAVRIASSNPEEHKLHLRQVFHRLDQCGVTVNPWEL